MVMPLVHESRPKCYICCESFESIEDLREHQGLAHGKGSGAEKGRSPAPGDVSVF